MKSASDDALAALRGAVVWVEWFVGAVEDGRLAPSPGFAEVAGQGFQADIRALRAIVLPTLYETLDASAGNPQ